MYFKRYVLAAAWLSSATFVHAAPVVHAGIGADATQAEAAFVAWQADVSSFSVDAMAGLGGTQGVNANLSSAAGNRFTTTDAFALAYSGAAGSVSGTSMQLSRLASVAHFTWTLAQPADSFGFFAHGTDDGVVTIDFVDGRTQNYRFATAGFLNDMFWGITGLDSAIASVTIGTTDSGGLSYWGRFATGDAAAGTVPEPASLLLLALGLGAAAAARRR